MKFAALFLALAGQVQGPPDEMPPSATFMGEGLWPSELMKAAALLDLPPGIQTEPPPEKEYGRIVRAIHEVAVRREILDERDTRYVLNWPKSFSDDLNMLRRRREELADAPPVGDSHRFPDRNALNEAVRFNRSFRKHVENRILLELHREGLFRRVLQETDELYEVWDTARDARCDFYYTVVRRQALKKLRDLIGEAAYAAGELPPAAPYWRFNELR